MIQDIAPKELDNHYINCQPEGEDRVVIFRGEEILLSRTGEDGTPANWDNDLGKEYDPSMAPKDRLDLPLRKSLPGVPDGELQYLFAISGTRYFLYCDTREIPESEGFHYENVRKLRQDTSKDVWFAAATAFHLYVWYRDNHFCGRCGAELSHDRNVRMLKCPKCGNEVFPKIAPAVIVGLCDGDRLLLTKYADRAYKRYALIAGFTEIGETPEETVKREVMEEVGLRAKNIRYYKSQPWGTDSNLLLGFFADLDGDDTVRIDEEELAVAEWFHRDEIPIGDDHISLTRAMVQAFKNGEV